MGQINYNKNNEFLDRIGEIAGMADGGWQGYLDAIIQLESTGNYNANNGVDFHGAYQFGQGVLDESGFVQRFGSEFNVHSLQDLQNNPAAQEALALMEFSGINSPAASRFTMVKLFSITHRYDGNNKQLKVA